MAETTDRPLTARRAVAEAEVEMAPETLSAIIDGSVAKGDVLSVAELAGVIGGKRTAELIPLAHPAGLAHWSSVPRLIERRVRSESGRKPQPSARRAWRWKR